MSVQDIHFNSASTCRRTGTSNIPEFTLSGSLRTSAVLLKSLTVPMSFSHIPREWFTENIPTNRQLGITMNISDFEWSDLSNPGDSGVFTLITHDELTSLGSSTITETTFLELLTERWISALSTAGFISAAGPDNLPALQKIFIPRNDTGFTRLDDATLAGPFHDVIHFPLSTVQSGTTYSNALSTRAVNTTFFTDRLTFMMTPHSAGGLWAHATQGTPYFEIKVPYPLLALKLGFNAEQIKSMYVDNTYVTGYWERINHATAAGAVVFRAIIPDGDVCNLRPHHLLVHSDVIRSSYLARPHLFANSSKWDSTTGQWIPDTNASGHRDTYLVSKIFLDQAFMNGDRLARFVADWSDGHELNTNDTTVNSFKIWFTYDHPDLLGNYIPVNFNGAAFYGTFSFRTADPRRIAYVAGYST